MIYSLTERNMQLASSTQHAARLHTESLERSIARTWTNPDYRHPEHLDFCAAISGDDLARLTRGPK